ncbi:hypothetical protein RDV64_07220 [Acuticoccus sp. MNP-M23]|uniref:hypothetical protein n=1 Tax=Acuticoccus sp. MNP-M23 TaxID=3072793 RepID=UPI002814BBF2|nr:hypothetical protein [Acuticoccus sp. MNP-M23]WMS44173.1 hypothetical protein RDV64_07220 [Acuticoccus sp. MNP-M23]
MEDLSLVLVLAIATLVVVALFAAYQRYRAYQAKIENEHSSLMDDPRMTHNEPRMPYGTEGPDGNPRPRS